jgi:integrase
MAKFLSELRQQKGTASRALEFTILTAVRTSEAAGAAWGEIDLAARIWTVPAERMKSAKEHRVPLSDAATSVLNEMRPPGASLTSRIRLSRRQAGQAAQQCRYDGRPEAHEAG